MGMKRIPATIVTAIVFVAIQVAVGVRQGAPAVAIISAAIFMAILVIVVSWFVFRITGRGK